VVCSQCKINHLFSVTRTAALFLLVISPVALSAQKAMPFTAATDSFLYMKVQLEPGIKLRSLEPGDLVDGRLVRSVYWRDKELLQARSQVRAAKLGAKKKRQGIHALHPIDHLECASNRARSSYWSVAM